MCMPDERFVLKKKPYWNQKRLTADTKYEGEEHRWIKIPKSFFLTNTARVISPLVENSYDFVKFSVYKKVNVTLWSEQW